MKPSAAPLRRGSALCRLLREAGGSSALEFAFAAPMVFLFVYGIVQSGQAMWLQNALNYAVAEAARCASVNQTTCGTSTQIKSYASTRSSYNFDPTIFTATTPSCGNQVSASFPLSFNIYNLPLSLTLTAQACFPT